MAVLGRSNRTKFRDQVLNPMLRAGLVEMTIPSKPRSSKQEYRLTEKGRDALEPERDSGTKGAESFRETTRMTDS